GVAAFGASRAQGIQEGVSGKGFEEQANGLERGRILERSPGEQGFGNGDDHGRPPAEGVGCGGGAFTTQHIPVWFRGGSKNREKKKSRRDGGWVFCKTRGGGVGQQPRASKKNTHPNTPYARPILCYCDH